MRKIHLILAACVVLLSAPAFAQTYSGVILNGFVFRTGATPCAGCVMTIALEGANGSATTASTGSFSVVILRALNSGTYNAAISISDGASTRLFSKRINVLGQAGNTAPVAASQSVSTIINTSTGVTLSYTDTDGPGPYTFTILQQPAHGTLSGAGAARTYTPAPGYVGADSFTWRVSDSRNNSNVATVTVDVRNPLSGEHPYLIVTRSQFQSLSDKASREPWASMKTFATSTCLSTQYLDAGGAHPTGNTISDRISRIMDTCTLSYIIDAPNRATYRQKILDTFPYYQDILDGQPSSSTSYWSQATDAYFYSIVALDVIHDDLISGQLATLEDLLRQQFVFAYTAPMITRHPPSRETFLLLWKLYTRNFTEMNEVLFGGVVDNDVAYIGNQNIYGFVTEYNDRINPDGVFREGPGYAHTAFAYDRFGRSYVMDALEFTGVGALYNVDFYTNPRWQNFFEWLYGYASTPEGMHTPFGDTYDFRLMSYYGNDYDNLFINNGHMIKAMQHSANAGKYAMWKNRAVPFDGRLYEYLFMPDPLPQPETAPSRIFQQGGGFFQEQPANDYSLYGVLWNMVLDEPDQVFHNRKDTNGLFISAYSESLLMGGGFRGASGPAGPDPIWYTAPNGTRYLFTTTYLGDRALSNNVALVDYAIDDFTNPTDVNDHALKSGGGVVEGFATDRLDYAVGTTRYNSTMNTLPIGTHERNLVFVHPQEGVNGYFIVFDEVNGINNRPVNLVFHLNTAGIQTVNALTEYDAPVGTVTSAAIGNVPANPSAGLTLFFATPPQDIQYPLGIRGPHFFNTYATAGSGNQIATVLFPYDSTHTKGAMTRMSGSGYTGARIDHGGNNIDYVIESRTTSQITQGGSNVVGKQSVFRTSNGNPVFYYVRTGTRFRNGNYGYESAADVSIFMSYVNGKIISPGTSVTLYYPGITGVQIDGAPASATSSGSGWVAVNVAQGEHTIRIVSTNMPPTVNAGTDIAIRIPTTTVSLNAFTTDDGQPSPLTYSWTASPTSGVIISSPTTEDTLVSVPGPGNYIFTLTASDGQSQSSDSVAVTLSNQQLGVIEAEDYKLGGQGVAYSDSTTGNMGGQYRSNDVDIYSGNSSSNGYHIDQFRSGEWLAYDIDIPASGQHSVVMKLAGNRVADFNMALTANGVSYPFVLPISQAFAWTNYTLSGISLPSGTTEMRIAANTNVILFDRFEISRT